MDSQNTEAPTKLTLRDTLLIKRRDTRQPTQYRGKFRGASKNYPNLIAQDKSLLLSRTTALELHTASLIRGQVLCGGVNTSVYSQKSGNATRDQYTSLRLLTPRPIVPDCCFDVT